MSDIYLYNGKPVKRQNGVFNPFDRSFALGDGLFETVKVAKGRAVWLKEHLERLRASAQFAGMTIAFSDDDIARQCAQMATAGKIADGFLRITLSRGESPSGRFSDIMGSGTLAITGGAAKGDAAPPAKAAFAPWPLNEKDPAVFHKTTSRFSSVAAYRHSRAKGVDELVFLNTKGQVAEGILSNIFWVRSGELLTPAVECGLLPGIARAKVLALAAAMGIKTKAGAFGSDALVAAEEIFFTNSIVLARGCAALDGRAVPDAGFAKAIRKRLLEEKF